MIEFLEAAACKVSSWLSGLGQANRLEGPSPFNLYFKQEFVEKKKKIEDILIF